jgi:hypothetical protein
MAKLIRREHQQKYSFYFPNHHACIGLAEIKSCLES